MGRLQAQAINISCSGRGGCYDNILEERLSHTLKYEKFYLRAYSDGCEAEINILDYYEGMAMKAPHCSLGGKTPHEANSFIGTRSSPP